MNKSILYFLFLFTVVSIAQSNKLYDKTYTKQDGLEIDDISTLCFDNDGFLWLGGSNIDNRTIILSDKKLGLQRFNGSSFHTIALPEYDNPIEETQQLYKRKDGKFYMVCKLADGYKLLLFDPYKSTFKPIDFEGSDYILTGLSDIISYNNEDYLLIQKNRTVSLVKLNADLSFLEIFNFTSSMNKFVIESSSKIIPFKDFIIISDDNFPLKIFNWNGTLTKTIHTVNTNTSAKPKRVVIDEVFVKDSMHYVFLTNNPNLYKIDETNKNIVLTEGNSLPSTHLNTYGDSFGNTRITASNNESLLFNSFNGHQLLMDYQLNIDVNYYGIKAVSKNVNKDIWLAFNGELHYYKFPSSKIKNILPDHQFRTIKTLDTENILVASEDNGWYKINTAKLTVSPYKITLNNQDFKSGARNIIIEDSIIWSNGNSGIIKVNTKTRNVKSFRHHPVLHMVRPNDSIIVYATKRYHLMQFNTKTETHKSLLETDSLNVYDLEFQKHNNLIIAGTDKGLLTFDLVRKTSKFYNNKNELEDPFILMTDYHKDYGYLLGTRSGNIIAFNAEDESFTTVYKDKLKAGIATILFDNDTWWINTFNGYVAYNIKDKSKTRFSTKDGFSNNEANRYSALKTKNGFYVGAIKGLNYFNPSELKPQKDLATLTLLEIKSYDKASRKFKNNIDRSHLDLSNTIVLPSENRALEVHFGLKYTNAVDNDYSYRYRLNTKDWVNLKHQNTIQFPNLAAGNYTLEIEASDFSGNKIDESLILKINSTEFFYKTWWFFLLVSALITAFLLWLLFQAKAKRELQETFSQDLIQSQEDERKRIARELHDSISQQLTLIKKKAQKINQDEITSLTHNTLEEVRAISRGLYPPLLKQLGLKESIEQLILEVDEQTDIFVSGDINNIDDFFNEDQTLNCYRFIQECINNILKHANAKALSLTVLKEDSNIEIKIIDNGKGFDAIQAQKQNSLGLKTINERIRILGGELSIDSKRNKGTTILAQIPIK